MTRLSILVLALAGVLAVPGGVSAQADPPWQAPKGGYDRPLSFMKTIDSVGQVQEMQFGSFQTNGYHRQVRLKLIGLEELNKHTRLAAALRPAAGAEPAPAPAAGGTGGAGGMLGRLIGGFVKDADQAKERIKDDLTVRVVEGGGPHDQPGAAVVDLLAHPARVSGSILGAKFNHRGRVTIIAEDFKPRLILMRYKKQGMFDNGTDAEAPEYLVESTAEIEEEGETRMTIAYDSSRKPPEGTIGNVMIAVTSVDGRATKGRYKIRYDLGS